METLFARLLLGDGERDMYRAGARKMDAGTFTELARFAVDTKQDLQEVIKQFNAFRNANAA